MPRILTEVPKQLPKRRCNQSHCWTAKIHNSYFIYCYILLSKQSFIYSYPTQRIMTSKTGLNDLAKQLTSNFLTLLWLNHRVTKPQLQYLCVS